MKIREIRLAAYGPFTNAVLDLPDDGPNFHILFGPNEAGKSTALRAIRRMLFGMPSKTGDNFLHTYPKLRIGAKLVNSLGDEIAFLRRKGRVKTLRDLDDETVLDDDALAPFLGGLGPEVFAQMFAIGHEDLIRGGEEIISGRGSVGEALFAAGAGLIPLQNVQKGLDTACGELFKPSGSTPSINRKIKAIKEARRDQKDALLQPKTWKEQNLALDTAQERMVVIKKTLAAHKQRQAKVDRIRDALPLIARKKEIDAELVAYQGLPDLADDFGEQRRNAEKELKMAQRDLERSREAREMIKREMEALPDNQALLENAGTIESLQQDLGSFRKAQKDRPALEGRMRTLRNQADDMMAEMRADISNASAADFQLPPSVVGEIQELGKEYGRLTGKKDAAQEQHHRQRHLISLLTERRKTLATPVDVSRIDTALQGALEVGPIENQLADICASNEALEDELNRMLKQQMLWNGSLENVDRLPLPSRENIDHFDRHFDALQRTIEKHEEGLAATESEIAQAQAEIEAIDLSQEVPTEADLKSARNMRDKGWRLVRGQLEGRTPPPEASREILDRFEDASDLPEAFENSMAHADHIADRLRREADQVSRKSMLQAQKTKFEKACVNDQANLKKVHAQANVLEIEWEKLWEPAGIAPQTPKEMHGWLAGIATLQDKLGELRFQQRKTKRFEETAASLRSNLLSSLEDAGAAAEREQTLSFLIKTAQTFIQFQRDLAADIAAADKELTRLKAGLEDVVATLDECRDSLAKWKKSWKSCIKNIGIRTDASPSVAIAVIGGIRQVRNKTDEADVLQKRIEGIDRDAAEFTSRVNSLVEIVVPDMKAEPSDRAAELLNGRLTGARQDASKKQMLLLRLETTNSELEGAKRRLFECRAVIESLCREAGCTEPESLAKTEERALAFKALNREQNELEQQIRRLGAGATVEEFIDEVAEVDADGITPEIQIVKAETESLEKEREELFETIGALKITLAQMDGSAAAVTHAEKAERLLAGLESDVEKYAQLKMASIILSRTVERYREKHQGPLISRASELFSQMTRGAFNRLRADYDQKGHPVLVGLRPESGGAVPVEGMSDGTADQLYLALRLASLEQFLDNNEPLPFVVDDILLRFDDQRALATLDVLIGLSEKTQVLFFTHHRHIVELAQKNIDAGKLVVLDLEG